MIETRSNQRPWRDAVSVLFAVVLAVAVVSVVLDGGRSAFAADDCQYGQYGQYGPYARMASTARTGVREGEAAAHDPAAASQAQLGWSIYDAATISDGNSPTGTLVFRLFGPTTKVAPPRSSRRPSGQRQRDLLLVAERSLHAARRPDGDVALDRDVLGRRAQRAGDERVRRGASRRGDPNVVRRPVSAPAHERPGWVVAVGAGLR